MNIPAFFVENTNILYLFDQEYDSCKNNRENPFQAIQRLSEKPSQNFLVANAISFVATILLYPLDTVGKSLIVSQSSAKGRALAPRPNSRLLPAHTHSNAWTREHHSHAVADNTGRANTRTGLSASPRRTARA